MSGRGCPTPEKIRYDSWGAAKYALRSYRQGKKLTAPTRAYRCRGGHWHLTSRA